MIAAVRIGELSMNQQTAIDTNSFFIALLGVALFSRALFAANQSRKPGTPYSPDNGDGTYDNPIIFADYSDPDVIRVNDDFYLTASSFSCFPGLPVLHSRDLVNWTIIGHAIETYPIDRFKTPLHGGGVWAPAIRFHGGWFYVFFGDPDFGLFMARTRNPAGPWEPLVRLKDAKGWIDPCPFWDDDGKAYLVHAFAGSRAGISNILYLHRMSPDGTHLFDEGKLLIDGNAAGFTTLEGPKLYKRNGFYFIMAPGGGVSAGYQIVFRSKNIYGPYESRVVLQQGDTPVNGPHQGAWVETQTSQSWFIHFQETLPYGRITHLQPVRWVDDWPVMGDNGKPVLRYQKPDVGKSSPIAVPQTSDEFDEPKLGLQWQWWANYHDSWYSLTARRGFLRLYAVDGFSSIPLFNRPNLLLQKFPAEKFSATACIDMSHLVDGDRAGLVVAGMLMAALQVQRDPRGLRIVRTTSLSTRPQGLRGDPLTPPDSDDCAISVDGKTIFLRVNVDSGGRCTFSFSRDGEKFTDIGPEFKAVNDLWIGAKVGIFCNGAISPDGFIDIDWFRLSF